jgi:hypothetical protein
MKKIFTLLVFSGILSVSFAQIADKQGRYDRGDDVAYGHRRNDNDRGKNFYYFSRREMQSQMSEIRRIYDRRIQDVKANWSIRPYRKRRLINELECRRDEEIKVVYLKFKNARNRYDDHDHGGRW